MLDISERTLRKMVAERTIPSMLVGGKRKFDPAALHRWVVMLCPEMARGRGVSRG
jgi:excisionase family DNA binding protein